MKHPLSNVRRWRAATHGNGKCPEDLKRDAAAAWRRFVACMRLLPPQQAMPLWQTVAAEVATHHIRVYTRKDVGRAVGMATPPE
jgi:hypothetical protein